MTSLWVQAARTDLQRSGPPGIHRLEGEKDFGFVEFDFEINLGLLGGDF